MKKMKVEIEVYEYEDGNLGLSIYIPEKDREIILDLQKLEEDYE